MTSETALPVRVIARLDVKGENVVKGVHLEGLRIVGKPGDLARRYYAEGADEIISMDVVASLYQRNSILSVVRDAARDVFVPLTVGGGIRSIEDIVDVLRSGADKVALNTAAVRNPAFLSEAARTFGSQCIVLSVEAKRREEGHWEVYTDNGRERTELDVVRWVVEAERLGVGEVLITSVDNEGCRKGFDLDLVREVRHHVQVPVIACGGAGSADHVTDLVRQTDVDAVCCASLFHYGISSIPALKKSLLDSGIETRL